MCTVALLETSATAAYRNRPPLGVNPRLLGVMSRPPGTSCGEDEVFRFRRCFLNGDGAGLGDPGCSREDFGPLKSRSILIASGASFRSGSSF